MPYKDLKDFIKRLEKEGELIRIKEELSPILEITEVTDRVCKLPGGGKALLFERPKVCKGKQKGPVGTINSIYF